MHLFVKQRQHLQTNYTTYRVLLISLFLLKYQNHPPLPLPLASDGVAPQSSLSTIGAKAMYPSTQCFLMVSMMEGGK